MGATIWFESRWGHALLTCRRQVRLVHSPSQRRRRSRGHIRELPSGSFQAIVYAGKDPADRQGAVRAADGEDLPGRRDRAQCRGPDRGLPRPPSPGQSGAPYAAWVDEAGQRATKTMAEIMQAYPPGQHRTARRPRSEPDGGHRQRPSRAASTTPCMLETVQPVVSQAPDASRGFRGSRGSSKRVSWSAAGAWSLALREFHGVRVVGRWERRRRR